MNSPVGPIRVNFNRPVVGGGFGKLCCTDTGSHRYSQYVSAGLKGNDLHPLEAVCKLVTSRKYPVMRMMTSYGNNALWGGTSSAEPLRCASFVFFTRLCLFTAWPLPAGSCVYLTVHCWQLSQKRVIISSYYVVSCGGTAKMSIAPQDSATPSHLRGWQDLCWSRMMYVAVIAASRVSVRGWPFLWYWWNLLSSASAYESHERVSMKKIGRIAVPWGFWALRVLLRRPIITEWRNIGPNFLGEKSMVIYRRWSAIVNPTESGPTEKHSLMLIDAFSPYYTVRTFLRWRRHIILFRSFSFGFHHYFLVSSTILDGSTF